MIEYIPGLEKVPAAQSSISFINGEEGILEYRGYRIEELGEKATFDEVTFLLLRGHLPTAQELKEFTTRLHAARSLSPELKNMLEHFPRMAHPMAALQTLTSAMGLELMPNSHESEESRENASIQFIGKFPTLVAAAHRARKGEALIEPDTTLGPAANFLYMVTGKVPDDLAAHVLDVSLVLHADHTMNASTFAARVTASTECEPAAALAAAVGSLSGPLHGGANERVLLMLQEIGSVENVGPWLENRLERKQKVMGLGHRVYKTKDPRATILQRLASELFDKLGSSPLYDIAVELERLAIEKLGGRGIYANVDFYSGIVYNKMDIPTDLFTPIFAISRISGWTAHWMEQLQHNRLFRPTQVYTGARESKYVPLAERTEDVRAG